MITIRYAPSFVRMYKSLYPRLKEEVKEKINLFRKKGNHAKLKVHKLHGLLHGVQAFTVNYRIRIVFEYSDKNTADLLFVGFHDNVYGA